MFKSCFYSGLLFLCFCLQCSPKKEKVLDSEISKEKKPNVVFILADDLGWADLSCYGNTFNETPNLDALSERGLRFTSGYASCPVCSPSRASILTGKYPVSLNITDWIPGRQCVSWGARPFKK